MRAKWRKIIWAILALQLFMIHLLVLERDYHLDYLIDKVVWHFGLPGVLYYRWRQLAVFLCLVVAVGILLFHYRNYRKFRGQCIRRLEPVTEEAVKRSLQEAVRETGLDKRKKREGEQRTFLYWCPEISDPFVIGFRNPILLLLEKTYDDTVLQFIFLHECRHMRQRDTVYKLFMLLMQSLLWFQPLMYLLKAVADRDVEVACDEAVVEGRDMAGKQPGRLSDFHRGACCLAGVNHTFSYGGRRQVLAGSGSCRTGFLYGEPFSDHGRCIYQ